MTNNPIAPCIHKTLHMLTFFGLLKKQNKETCTFRPKIIKKNCGSYRQPFPILKFLYYTGVGPVGRRCYRTIWPNSGLTGQFCFLGVGLTRQFENLGRLVIENNSVLVIENSVLVIENKSISQDNFALLSGPGQFFFQETDSGVNIF